MPDGPVKEAPQSDNRPMLAGRRFLRESMTMTDMGRVFDLFFSLCGSDLGWKQVLLLEEEDGKIRVNRSRGVPTSIECPDFMKILPPDGAWKILDPEAIQGSGAEAFLPYLGKSAASQGLLLKAGSHQLHALVGMDPKDSDSCQERVEILSDMLEILSLRRQADRQLRERNLFSRIAEQSQNALIVADNHLKILYLNDAARRLYITKDANIIGSSLGQFCSDFDRETLTKKDIQALHDGKMIIRNVENHRADGGTFMCESRIQGIFDDEGGLSACLNIRTDISERIRQHEEAEEQRNRLDSIIRGTSAGTWEWNVQSQEITVNDRWIEMLGYTREELEPVTFDTWARVAHPDDLDLSNQILEKHFRGEIPEYSVECRIRHKDGHFMWINDRGKVMERDEQGNVLKMYGVHLDISERKEQELKIENSENNLKTFFESLDDLVFILDEEGCIQEMNPAVSQKLGYSRKKLLGRSVYDLYSDELRDEAKKNYSEMVSGKRDVCPLPLQATDGHFVPVESKVRKGYWNKQPALLALSKDLSLLQEAKDRFEKIFHESPIALALSRIPSRKLTLVNQAFLDVTGYTEEEVLGRTSRDLHLWTDGKLWKQFAEKFAEQGEVRNERVNFRNKAGEPGLGLYSGITFKNQMESYLLSSFVDLTRLQQAEIALKEKEMELELFFSQSLDGFFFLMLDEPVAWNSTIDREKTLDYVFEHQRMTRINKALLDQYGYKQDEMLNLRPLDFYAHDIEMGRALWKELFDEGHIHVETDERRKDGSQMYVEGDYICLYDDQGRITGNFGIQRDVTDRRKAEIRLRESNEELKTAVEELERTQSILVRQERLAAVGQLAAGFSHNFNNLLTGILGTAELMKMEKGISQRQSEFVSFITRTSERAAQLVRQITDFGRRTVRIMEVHSISRLIQDALVMIQASLPENTTLLVSVENCDDCSLKADATQIEQVLLNLIFNARDAMEDGGEIRVTMEKVILKEHDLDRPGMDRPIVGTCLHLTVADDGPGIPEEYIRRIFEPFFTTKEVGKGTGLGLSQVYGIVSQYDGVVFAESPVGGGAVFHVYLPLEERAVARILLVENDSDVLMVTSRVLRELGFMVETAEDGHRAFDLFSTNPDRYRVVISDVRMPGVSGIDLVRKIRELRPGQEMILISGYFNLDEIKSELGRDHIQFLEKPLSFGKLKKVLSSLKEDKSGGNHA